MNNPNPFIPQGSLLEQKNKKRARVKVAVFSIFAVNLLVIAPLLIQGCSPKKETTADDSSLAANTAPAISNAPDTNMPSLPSITSTSAPPAMSNVAPMMPPPPPPPVVPETPATTEYVVLKGDSFYTIALKFHVKMKDVEAANPKVVPTKLKAGDKIQIPGGTGAAAPSGTTAMADSGGETVYVVKPKDTLTKIAKETGTTVKALRAANNLKSDSIQAGKKLKVPSKAAPVEAPPAPAPMPAPAPVVMPPPSAPTGGTAPGH
jgi:LysM repeat protein